MVLACNFGISSTKTATKKYGKLLYGLIEMQQLGAELLGRLSVEHAEGNSVDGNTAFANILVKQEADLLNLKSMNFPCNKAKIYDDSKNPPVLKNLIDVKVIDSTLQKDILFYLEGFPTSKPSKADRKKKVNCGSCGKSIKKEDFCCGKCKFCKNCNKNLQLAQQCPIYILNFGLETDRLLRNLVSHLTIQSLKNFLDGNQTFPDFRHVNKWQDLCQEFINTMTCISGYMCVRGNFTNQNVVVMQPQDKTNRLNKLKLILKEDTTVECDLNLLLNLKQIIKEQHLKQIDEHRKQINEIEKVVIELKDTIERNQHDVSTKLDKIGGGVEEANKNIADIKKTLDDHFNIKTSKDNENEENIKEEMKSWRSIAGGVVIRMDSTENRDEVSFVSYCDVNGKTPIKINDKAPANPDGEPYYETHMIDDSSMTLKIEYLKDGDYKIEVARGSITDKFEVSINYKYNNPAHTIQSKIGIIIPCSDNKKYWEKLIGVILDPSTNNDRVLTLCYSNGASSTTNTLTMTEFERLAAEYFKVNFADQNLIVFPPFHTIDDKYRQTLVKLFKNILEEKYTAERRGAILVAPNITYLSRLIDTTTGGTEIDDCCDEKCLLVFVEQISLVLVVRIAPEGVNIKEEISKCKENVNNFIQVNGYRISEEGINIAGIIACPTVERKKLKNILPFQFSDVHSDIYESMFICKDDIAPERNSFHYWWDSSIKSLHKRLELSMQKTFTKMIGQYMVAMASVKESLPTISSNPHEQLKTLILNKKQLCAINSPSMRKHITGPFGSGKTLVGQSILRNFMIKLKGGERSTLIYVVCDNYAMIDCHVKTSMEKLSDDKVQFICGSLPELYREHIGHHSSSESSLSLDRLMKELAEKFPNTHFVCDEVQCAVMTEDVAANINGYLQNVLRNSHVVFIQQSMNKNRKYQQCLLEADNFHLINGLEKHQLHSVMRMSVEIQMLIDSAQEVITKHDVIVTVRKPKEKLRWNTNPVEKRIKVGDTTEQSPEDTTDSTKLLVKIPLTQEESKNTIFDLDASLKIISQTSPNKSSKNRLPVITGINVFTGKKGHKILSGMPQLIFLPETDEIDTIKVVSLVFNNLGFSKTPVFVANSLQSARLLHHSVKSCNRKTILYIPYLQRRTPTTLEKGNVISKDLDSLVLITDHKSFLGMEHEVVATIVDPSEKFMRHSILEIISRCTSKLYVFVLPQKFESESGTMEEILKRWRENGLVETMSVNLDVNNDDSGPIKINDNLITIYTQSEKFQSLSNEIEKFSDAEFREHSPDKEIRKFLNTKIAEIHDRGKDEEQSIFHLINYGGRLMSFFGVYDLLRDGDYTTFQKLFRDDKNILNNLRNEHNDETFLIRAFWSRHLPVIEYLMKNFPDEIDVWAADKFGGNAYHHAAYNDNDTAMELLLSFDRSRLDSSDSIGRTPLHYAAVYNNKRIVELLLNAGAAVDVVDNEENTPDRSTNDDEIIKMIQNHRKKTSS